MENKGGLGVYPLTKSSLPTFNPKPKNVNSHQDKTPTVSKPEWEKEKYEFPGRMEGEKKKNEGLTRKRPSTVSGNFRVRAGWEKSENLKGKNGKGEDRRAAGIMATTPKSVKEVKVRSTSLSKSPARSSKLDVPRLPGSSSLLSLAIEAQQQTTATMRLLRDALRKKAEEVQARLKAEAESKGNVEPPKTTVAPNYPGPSACFFENSYANCLDEVFQAWINLLYLIINLKVSLSQVVGGSQAETLKPDLETEKVLITQATECVKFFSQLKMKSLMEGFEEMNLLDNPQMKNFEILDFENRISSSFFSEMETLSKKAKEMMMDHLKKEASEEVN